MKICICEKHNIPFLMYTVKSKYINGDDFHDYSLLEFCVSNVNNDFILYKLFRVRVEVAAPQTWGTRPGPFPNQPT